MILRDVSIPFGFVMTSSFFFLSLFSDILALDVWKMHDRNVPKILNR